ncbi:hypothetical protein MTO96_003875 [Rhipicephalus appendiculatus]
MGVENTASTDRWEELDEKSDMQTTGLVIFCLLGVVPLLITTALVGSLLYSQAQNLLEAPRPTLPKTAVPIITAGLAAHELETRAESCVQHERVPFLGRPDLEYWGHVEGALSEAEALIRSATIAAIDVTAVPATGQKAWHKAAALFKACMTLASSHISEVRDLTWWLASLGLDLNHLNPAVDPVDMVMRSSLDFGVPAVFDATLSDRLFIEGKRSIQPSGGEMFSRYTDGVYGGRDKIVYQKELLSAFAELLGSPSVGPAGLRCLVAWSLFRQLLPYARPPLNTGGKETLYNCYSRVGEVMELGLTSHYLQSAVNPQAVHRALDMFARVREAFGAAIQNSSWLVGTERNVALRKLANMKVLIGGPEQRWDEPYVDQRGLPDTPSDRFFLPWLKARSVRTHHRWLDQTNFLFDVGKVNAFYERDTNVVIVPAVLLQPVFFFPNGNEAFNYGGLGDALRRKRHLQLDDTIDSENLADFVGAAVAYAAFHRLPALQKHLTLPGLHLTPDQLFFVGRCTKTCRVAEVTTSTRYATARSRCNVPLMNMESFARAFRCGVGTRMNPVHKCSFWD